ncbi:thiamine pyrophosphate-binding protein [Puniceibacterium sp. IMCC21224]|uniref:thiamine pyrophosphate-binding protein n=1 Tax=Puniceibacterium sp. IMCC21224 TaxID=1618204 RepID=UPI00065D7C4F|nr:thiamine pyrophosphate-dependent enzyme [Puniceibacterium sp. IMCC21224]KMK65040.1 thiamine pyrophosphate-dependent enzyme, possible carboligase or decarboxylase [Puniceibacterium sp. IMCC21224]
MPEDMSESDWKAEVVQGPLDETLSWGSDVPAAMLRQLGIPYIALTPGASYRGFHDSLVNHLGNERPEMLLCLHEEHAVAIAHGYAKVTGVAMAVALHSNVGLMHGTMAIFNAFADRAPMLILGATGPMDATERRPWIDWLHTTQDQGAMIRPFIKWDDQPGSAAATPEAMMRGWKIANSAPYGPVYINLDAGDQESPLESPLALPDPARFAPLPEARPDGALIAKAAQALLNAKAPVILFGRGARTTAAMEARVALAERLGAAMLSDLKAGTMVPSDHPNHAGAPFNKLQATARAVLEKADVILSLAAVDLGGVLKQAYGDESPTATIIHASLDQQLHSGWNQEHFALAPVDIELNCSGDAAVADLLAALPTGTAKRPDLPPTAVPDKAVGTALTNRDIATALKSCVGDSPLTFAGLSRGFPVDIMPHRHPLDFIGKDGGGGVGSGPGLTIGAALALKGSGRIVVGSLGDGDTLMSTNALWTAAKYRIPALFLISNNRSYFNDELHQESVAKRRGRNPANAWVGQQLDNPAPDIAGIARSHGVEAIGPIETHEQLNTAMAEAVAAVRAGRPFLLDILIDPRQGREKEVKRNTKGG